MTNGDRLEIIEIIRNDLNFNIINSSAEVKAWQRINSETEDQKWMIVDNIGEEMDLEQIKQEFNQRGYKSKISILKTSFR